jgi:hypothetical protein
MPCQLGSGTARNKSCSRLFLASVALIPAEGEAANIAAAGTFSLTYHSRRSEILVVARDFVAPRDIIRCGGANVAPRDIRPH